MQGAKVLIVDDDDEIRGLMSQFLAEEGYRPLTAGNGREAIDLLDPNGPLPDIMLLDLVMPDMDGHAVLDHLRRNLLQEFPVLIISAKRPDSSILTALDTEARDFIAKPFELEEMLVRMQRLLRSSPRLAGAGSGHLRVYTLGALRVYRDHDLLFDESWRNKPAKTIFKMLFTHRGQRHAKDRLAEELWPETQPEVAINRLRVAIHELRKMLNGTGKRASRTPSYICQQEGAYFFDDTASVWSDVQEFEEWVAQARDLAEQEQPHQALDAYRRAEALYQGDYLRDDAFFDWSLSTRERLREAHLSMLSDVARLHAMLGHPDAAAGFCRKILRIEPWREEVYRRLMEYLVEAGRQNEALRVFDECCRVLQTEIEAHPSAETVRLRERILQSTWQHSPSS